MLRIGRTTYGNGKGFFKIGADNFGLTIERVPDARGKQWLVFFVWYPVRWNKELDYLRASIRWF